MASRIGARSRTEWRQSRGAHKFSLVGIGVDCQRGCRRCRVPVPILWDLLCAGFLGPGPRATDRRARPSTVEGWQHLIAIGIALVSAVATPSPRCCSSGRRPGMTSTAPSRSCYLLSVGRAGGWRVTSTLSGAALHVVALRFGPLTLVQPLGVSALVMALPLGAWFAGQRRVLRAEWAAAGAVVLGLLAVLTLAPRHVPAPAVPPTELAIAVAVPAPLLLISSPCSTLLPRKAAPVCAPSGLRRASACLGHGPADRRGHRLPSRSR